MFNILDEMKKFLTTDVYRNITPWSSAGFTSIHKKICHDRKCELILFY